jgi:sulfopyruvate decarboxylase alpha subunit
MVRHDTGPDHHVEPSYSLTPTTRSVPLTWSDQLLESLRNNDVDLTIYVPDEVLTPLIRGAEDDPNMEAFPASREEEAIGIAAGAALGGRRSVVLMQSSGYGNSVNALASLAVPYQLPILMIIGERGVLGEFNPVQVPISRAIRPSLDAMGIPHRTLEREDEVAAVADRMMLQCFRTQLPAVLFINALLTGGKNDR